MDRVDVIAWAFAIAVAGWVARGIYRLIAATPADDELEVGFTYERRPSCAT